MKEPKLSARNLWTSRAMASVGIVMMVLSINTLSDWALFPGFLLTVAGFVFLLRKNSEVRDISYYKTMVDWED